MMPDRTLHAVTGAFGYSGKYIAKRLLASDRDVMTLTNSVNRENPFGDAVAVHPFNFDKPELLAASLKNVAVLYNTYWVRFSYRTFTHADAVANTRTLFQAAKEAGVERVVHVSITNPSQDSDLGYFKCKAEIERALVETGISHAILRPAILFGKEDILVNNIAWALRRLPVFGVFGDGRYRIQPIYVDDLARLAVEQGESRRNTTIDAIGPETFVYRDMIKKLGQIIGKDRPVVSVPPSLGYYASRLMGIVVNDVIMTWEEMQGLMRNLLYVDSPPAGTTKLTEWAKQHADTLGLKYANELARRKDRKSSY